MPLYPPPSAGGLDEAAHDALDHTGLTGVGSDAITDPTDITGCVLWLDASDATTINAGGPVNNDPVSTWADKSGNDFDATQADAGVRPVYETDVMGALDGVTFDGTQSLGLSGAALDILRAQPGASLFVVAAYNGDTSPIAGAIFSAWRGAPAGQYDRLALFSDDSGFAKVEAARLDGDSVSAWDFRTHLSDVVDLHVHAGIVDWAKGQIRARSLDTWMAVGAQLAINAYGSAQAYTSTRGLSSDTASEYVVIGGTELAVPENGYPYTGSICELVLYDRALNAVEQRRVFDYLAVKWEVV